MIYGQPNFFAYLMIILCVPIGIAFCARYRPSRAVALAIFGGAMFLPELIEFDFPVLPAFNKESLAPLGAFLGAMFFFRKRLSDARPMRGADLLFTLMLFGNVGTWLTNSDFVHHGGMVSPPVTLYDTISLSLRDLLTVYLPFLLGRSMFTSAKELRLLVAFYVSATLIYSVLCLYEVRMSPQLNFITYNFQQLDFVQSMRGGGYRPLIFMSHGICVARFMLGGVIAAAAMARAGSTSFGLPGKAVVWYLAIVLVLCKSTGALVLAAVCFPLAMWASVATQFRAALLLAAFVVLFPALRGAGLFPAETLVEWAKNLSEERASSLEDRFEQDDLLIVKARERPVFGWGFFARNQVEDPLTGRDLVIDGEWMIVFGCRGIIGYFAWYGMYLVPVFNACRKWRRIRNKRDQHLLAALTLVAAVFALDTVPNSAGSVPQVFICAALLGATEGVLREQRRRAISANTQPVASAMSSFTRPQIST